MQSQQHAQRDFIARAKMLAHVMTSSSNITVTISGDTAYCSFGHINLPAGDYTDPVFRKMVQGWIDHELGHEDESEHCHAKEASQNKVLKDIFGRIEDVRMETSRGRKFRGAKTNLAVLAELAIDRELFCMPTDDKSIGSLIINHILYRGRSSVIGQHCLDEFSSQGHKLLAEKVNQSFADGLNDLIDMAATLTDSQGSLDLSKEILAYIEQEDKTQQQQDNADDNQMDPDTQDATGDSDNSNSDDPQSESTDPGDTSETDTNTDSNDGGNGNSSNSFDSSNEQDDGALPTDLSTSGSDSSNSDVNPVNAHDIVNSSPTSQQSMPLMQALEECDEKDFHEAVAEMISSDVAEQPNQSRNLPDFDFVEDATNYRFNSDCLDVPLARRLSANVFQALHKVIIDIQPDLPVTRKRGKRINGRLFSGISAGNTKVFHSRVEQEVREAAVCLVIDASPSMRCDERIKHANTCALAFALALQRLNIAFEVVYYGSKEDQRFQMYRPKTFGSTLKTSSFEVETGNWSTPTGEAMQFALSSLAIRSENNKLMLLLTDGDPDSYERVQQSHQLAKAFGVRVVPFALCTDFVRGFGEHEFVSIPEPTALTPALRQATKQKLFA